MMDNNGINIQVNDADFRLAAENAYDHVIITDKEGVVIYANRGVERVTGFAISEILGTKAGKLWGGLMSRDFYLGVWQQLLVKQEPWIGEMINKRKNGTQYTADVRISPIFNEQHEIIKFVGIERDISIYKQAEEQAVREAAILSSLGECLVVTDRSGKILMVNRAFEETTGYRFSEVAGQSMLRVLTKVDEKDTEIPDEQRSLTLVLNGSTPKAQESTITETHYYRLKNGRKFPITGTVTPIYVMDKLLGAVQVFRDISEEKEVDRIKTDVLSLVAHQLKTPIGQLKAYLDNMLSGVVGNFSSTQNDYLVSMDQVLDRLSKMTTNILNASRIERGVIQFNLQPVSLNKLISQIKRDYDEIAKHKGVSLEVSYQDDISVMADEVKLSEVLGNVVDNALKFTDKGKVSIAVKAEGLMAVLEISDTGTGMSQDMLVRLFDRDKGTNIPASTKTGSRLGMYIAKTFMEKQHGTITAISVLGQGSTFRITIPLTNKV